MGQSSEAVEIFPNQILSDRIPFEIAVARELPEMQMATNNFYRSGIALSNEDHAATRQAVVDFYIGHIKTTEHFSTVEHILRCLDKSLSHLGCNSIAEADTEDKLTIAQHLKERSLSVIENAQSSATAHMTIQNYLRSMRYIGSPVESDARKQLFEVSSQCNSRLCLSFGDAASEHQEAWTNANRAVLRPAETPHLSLV